MLFLLRPGNDFSEINHNSKIKMTNCLKIILISTVRVYIATCATKFIVSHLYINWNIECICTYLKDINVNGNIIKGKVKIFSFKQRYTKSVGSRQSCCLMT